MSRRTISVPSCKGHEIFDIHIFIWLLQTSLSPLLIIAYLENLWLFTILQESPYLLIRLFLLIILQCCFHDLFFGICLLSQGLRLGKYLLSVLIHELFEHIELLLLSTFLLLCDAKIGLDHWSLLLLHFFSLFLVL